MSLSIITTVLNNEKFIHYCLRSVKSQKIRNNIEHIIVDGGSTDKTFSIIKKFQKKNRYVKVFQIKNIGIYQGINYGIKNAKYKYVGLLHSDDFYKNNKVLKEVLKILNKKKTLQAIYSNVEIVKRDNKKKILRFFKSKQLKSNDLLKCKHPPHTSLFLKRSLFKKFGLYNDKLKIASDFELMLRFFGKNKVNLNYINKTFVVMRSGGTSTKGIINILYSNFEVFKSFQLNKIKINPFYILKKIITKIFQIKLI